MRAERKIQHNRLPAVVTSLHTQALNTIDAVDLIHLGARVPLTCQLTGLERSTARRLYRQIRGYHAPAGQAPFTDAWYLKNDLRMIHATIIWRLYQAFQNPGQSPARILIDLYDTYTNLVQDVLLDITRAAFVPNLVVMDVWLEQRCDDCTLFFIGPVEGIRKICPACKAYHRFRCKLCGRAMTKHASGRYRDSCERCARHRKRRKSYRYH